MRAFAEPYLLKCFRSADFDSIVKGIKQERITLNNWFNNFVKSNINLVIKSSLMKKNWALFFLLQDNYDYIPISIQSWNWVCTSVDNYDIIKKCIVQKRVTFEFFKNIRTVPTNIQDLYIDVMQQVELNECLIETFDNSYNRDCNNELLMKLLKAGADGNYLDKECSQTPFEWSDSISMAEIFSNCTQNIDRTIFLHKVMYKIIDELTIHKIRRNRKKHKLTQFTIQRFVYTQMCGICNENTDLDIVQKFFRDNNIPYEKHDRDFIKDEDNEKFKEDVVESWNRQEFITFQWKFPCQGHKNNKINYWCWHDHLPHGTALWIYKYNLIMPRNCGNDHATICSSKYMCTKHRTYILKLVVNRYKIFFPREMIKYIIDFTIR